MTIDYSLSIDDYHAHEAISRSVLSMAGNAPTAKHFHSKLNEKPDSEALRFGNALHKYILEPELFEKYAVDWLETASVGTKFIKHEATLENGYFLIPVAWRNDFMEIAKAIKEHKYASSLLGLKGDVEATFFWDLIDDEGNAFKMKSRPDFFAENIVIDLKSTNKTPTPEEFQKSVMNFDYDLQAYMTMRGIEESTGKKPDGFVFIVVEKTAPFSVNVFSSGDTVLEIGEIKFNRYLEKYKKYIASNDGFDGVQSIEYPDWYIKKFILGDL